MNKIESNNLSKSFFIDGVEIKVLNKINISIKRGDLVALSGKSGAGKSTLLQILVHVGQSAPRRQNCTSSATVRPSR